MRTSWHALFNRTAYTQFLATTLGLLAATLYVGIAFKDIAVIKLIKGATLGVSIMFIFPSLFFIKLLESGKIADGGSRQKFQLIRYLCILMIVTGCVQGFLALL